MNKPGIKWQMEKHQKDAYKVVAAQYCLSALICDSSRQGDGYLQIVITGRLIHLDNLHVANIINISL